MATGVIAVRSAAATPELGWMCEVPALAPVANRPLVLHAIDTVRAAGADAVVVVADAPALVAFADVLDPDVERVEVAPPAANGDALLAAADRLRGERILVLDADGLLLHGAETLRAAISDDRADATVFYKDLGERISGVHVFSDSVLGALEEGADLQAAVDRLAAGGGRVQAGVLGGWWSWDACGDRLLAVNRTVLDALEPSVARDALQDSRLEGRVRVHPTARVERAVIRGPVIIGAHARVTDAYVGPYSTVGDGAVIENSEIESTIVMPRARIRHVGVRVEASIIGAGATVERDFSLPKALRLQIGAGASISLA